MNIRKLRNQIHISKFYQKKPNWTILFFFGFFIGTIVTQVLGKNWGIISDLYSEANLKRLKYLQIDGGELLFFVLKERIISFATILCLSTTSIGILFLWIYVLGLGFAIGAIIASAIYRFGIAGSLLAAAGMMPHMIFYVPVLYALLNFGYHVCVKLHFPKWESAMSSTGDLKQNFLRIIGLVLVVIIGIITESYVNPFIIKVFLKLFV